MKQEVSVLETKDGKFIAGCDKTACEGCKGSFFCTSKENIFEVLNPEKVELKKGDHVEIDMQGGKTVFTIFMCLGLPLLMFLPGYFVANCFSSSDAIRFCGGIAGVAIGFLIAAIYFKLTKKNFIPTLSRKD